MGSDAVMVFHSPAKPPIKENILLKRRSMVFLTGDSRHKWKHEIPKRKTYDVDGKRLKRGIRTSITFRHYPDPTKQIIQPTMKTPIITTPTIITIPKQTIQTQTRADYLFNVAKIAVSYGFVPIPVRGKTPVIPKWQKSRIKPTDPESVARRVKHLVKAKVANNVAILCGKVSNIVVVDIDVAKPSSPNGKKTLSGVEYWNQLVTLKKQMPETFTVRTPSRGYHIYFAWDDRMEILGNSNSLLGQRIDFRTNAGIVNFPGSMNHKTGKLYEIFSGFKNNLPVLNRMPDWLYNFIKMHQQQML